MADREAWLNGWPRLGPSVLMGTGIHCVGCGAFAGTVALALGFDPDDDWTEPDTEPDWPFDEDTCPIHRIRPTRLAGTPRPLP